MTTNSSNSASGRLKGENGKVEATKGVPLDGTVDPTGEYPRRTNWFGSNISAAGRGVKINNLSIGGGDLGVNFDIAPPNPSIYPFNYANETPSGHSFEIDDTPGNERILIKHHTGAGVEVQPDGTVVIVSQNKSVHVSNGHYNMKVNGAGHITYNGDLNMTVNGNYNLDVAGNYNVTVGNNHNHQVKGTQITEVTDVHQTIVRGNMDLKVYGDALDFHVGEKKFVTKKDFRIIPKRDLIVNSQRHVRFTAEEMLTASTGKNITLASEKMNITGRKGKIGGDMFHYFGSLYTGPSGDKGDPLNDQGKNVVFHGNLIGRALEAWTAKYSLYAGDAHSAWRATHAVNDGATAAAAIAANPRTNASAVDHTPDYDKGFKWGWNVEDNTVYEQQLDILENYEFDGEGNKTAIDPVPISPFYGTNEDWFEVWNKTSPFAVRKVYVDEDGSIENKLYKPSIYSHYFTDVPTEADIRSKLRTMHDANDPKTAPEGQTDKDKAIEALIFEDRLSEKWFLGEPPAPYEIKRKGKEVPKARFGYTLLGNPVERASTPFTPKNKPGFHALLIDPLYNPFKQETPITSSTKLSRTATMSTFLAAPGSRASLDMIPIEEDRVNLAKYWVCHAQILDGVNSSPEWKDYTLKVSEGYYHPASGVREHFKPGEDVDTRRYWREPYRNEDGGIKQRTLSGHPVNQRRHEGMFVFYQLFNSRGKIDYSATFDCALYIRDTFFFREMCLDYDMTRPDDVMTAQIGIYMPVIERHFAPDAFKGGFEQKVCTYFNRAMICPSDLWEITDQDLDL